MTRGTTWFASVGRYNARFPRIFRAGKWRPTADRPLWSSLFGVRQPALIARAGQSDSRNRLMQILRVESLEKRQMLAFDVAVVGRASSTDDSGFLATRDQLNDSTEFLFNATFVSPSDIDTVEELAPFEAVVIGGADTNTISGDSFEVFLPALRSWVEAGGGVVATGWAITDAQSSAAERDNLNAILGVNVASDGEPLPDPITVAISSAGHFVTDGVNNFAIDTASSVEAPFDNLADFGATVVATVSSGGAQRLVGVVADVGTGGRSVYLGPLYMVTTFDGNNTGLRSGDADRLLEQAVAWAAKADVAPNTAPTITASPQLGSSEGGISSSYIDVSDADGDTVTVTASVGTIVPLDFGVSEYRWDLPIPDGPLPGQPLTVTFTAEDGRGGTATTSIQYQANNVVPALSVIGASSVAAGTSHQITLSSSDPGDDTLETWWVNWGDGSAIESFPAGPRQTTDLSGSISYTTSRIASHTYLLPGNYTITARAIDEDCDDTDSDGDSIPEAAYAAAPLGVTVTAVNDAPVWVTPADLSLAENDGDGVGLEATDDATAAADLTFAITGGADQGLFAIVESADLTPRIRLAPPPAALNFESPSDADSDGVYDVEVTVRDGNGGATARLFHVTVTNVAEGPVAHAGGPYTIVEGQGLQLDGSLSHDPDDAPGTRSIVKYEWDFDYNATTGFQADFESQTADPFCRWIEELSRSGITDNGQYTLALVVTDDTGRSSPPATAMFTVDTMPPVVEITGGHVVAIGHDYEVTFNSTDPGDDTVNRVFIDWGDGSPIQVADVTEGSKDPATGETKRTLVIPHVFETKGNYQVTFYGDDEDCDDTDSDLNDIPDAAYRTNTLSVTVGEAPVAEAGGPYTTTEGSSFVLDASRSTDDGAIRTFTWTQVGGPLTIRGVVTPVATGGTNINWDFGADGTIDQVTTTPRVIVPKHVLSRGSHAFELTVTDDVGLSSTDTAAVTVLPPAGASVNVADLDGDGRLDLVTVTNDDAGSNVRVEWTVDAQGPIVRITNAGAVVAVLDADDCDDDCDFVLDGGAGDDHFTATATAGFTIGTLDVNGGGGDDLFTVTGTFTDGSTRDVTEITYDGGDGSDALESLSFNYSKIEFRYDSPSDGKVTVHDISVTKATTITYTGLEPISYTGSADEMVFTLTAGDDAATLTNNGDGTYTLSGATFEDTTFSIPADSLTIEGADGTDSLSVADVPAVPVTTFDFEDVDIASTTVVVSPATVNGWQFTTSSTSGIQFEPGPDTAPLGTGSVEMSVGSDGNGAAQLRNPNYGGVKLADLTTLAYSAYVDQDGSGGQAPYIILQVDLDGNLLTTTDQDLLFFEPVYQGPTFFPSNPQGPLAVDAWQEWDALSGGWWSVNGTAGATPGTGVKSLGTIVAAHPNAVIRNSGSGAGGVRFVTGFGAGAWDNFVGNVDEVSIDSMGGAFTTFDFEPVAPAATVYVDDDWDTVAIGADPDGAGPATSFGHDAFDTVQGGVDGVATGGTVIVLDGTYDEHVVIDKGLTLDGSGDATVIKPADASRLTSIYNTGAGGFFGNINLASIIQVSGAGTAGVTIRDLTVDGSMITSLPAGAAQVSGITVGESAAVIDNVTVQGMNNVAPASVRTHDVWLNSVGGTAVTVEVANSTLNAPGRNGIVARGADLTVDIHDNTITGGGIVGPSQVPNGIVLIDDAGGTIADNTISAQHYSAFPTFAGSGVLLFDARDGVVISGNEIFDTDDAIILNRTNSAVVIGNNLHDNIKGVRIEAGGSSNNSITQNVLAGNTSFGIEISDTAGAGNSAFNNSITGSPISVNNLGAAIFDASGNWWGTSNAATIAAGMAGLVDYTPWLNSGTDTSADTGFQGDFSSLTVDDNSPQAAATGRIQEGINFLEAGGVVIVLDGVYDENVVIDKSLDLLGPNAATAGNGSRAPEATITGSGNDLIAVFADDVTIAGFTLDGDDVAGTGIYVEDASNVDVANNIIQEVDYATFWWNNSVSTALSGNLVDANLIQDLSEGQSFGVLAFNSAYVSVISNEMTGVDVGVFEQYMYLPNGSGNADNTISGNEIAAALLGYGMNERGTDAATTALTNNSFTIVGGGTGVQLLNVYKPEGVTLTDNTIAGADVGVYAFISGGSASISGGSIDGAGTTGVHVTNYLADFSYAATGDGTVSISGTSINGYETGVLVEDHSLGAFAVELEVGSGNAISGGTTGLRLDGPDASLADDTLNDLAFAGQSGDYITLSNAAYGNGVAGDRLDQIDATAVTFGGQTGASMTAAQRIALEGKLTHEPDDGTLGFILVDAVNDAPVATDDVDSTAEDTPIVLSAADLLSNDTDVDGDTLTITSVSNAVNGAIVDNGDGTFTFTPAPNFNGAASFDYTISDGNGGSDTGTVNISVTPVNDDPVADDDLATVVEDTSDNTIDVLANDDDVEGNVLTVTAVSDPAHGTAAVSPDGLSVIYTPDADYFGADSFTYTISDGNGGTATATVDVTVTNVNDDPVAGDDLATVAEDSTDNVIVVLANDNDGADEGETLEITAVTDPAHGTAAVSPDGLSVLYTPDANYFGPDSFTYTISDGNGGTATATVDVTVTNVNDNPVANDDIATVVEDTADNAINVLANDNDGVDEGETLTVTAVTDPAHGTAVVSPDGLSVLYTPDADYFGPDSFSYTISDGNGGTATATVDVTVTNVNDAPVAMDDNVAVAEDSVNNLINVLGNDDDADGDTITVTDVGTASHGTVTIGTGGIRYTPTPNYSGPDSFTYTVSDGNGGTDTATVHVNVTPVNDAPVATDDTATTAEDTPISFTQAALVGNDTDIDGDTLTVTAVGNAVNGSVVLNGDGTITFTPAANFHGAASFDYTVSDGNGGTDTGTVSITVTPVNDAPVAVDDTATTAEDTPVTVSGASLLGNDSDVDGDTVTITGVSNAVNGAVVDNGDGTFTFTPAANFHGAASFDYTISDGNGGTDTGTVNITVTPVNDAPVAEDDTATTVEDTPVTISEAALVGNDADTDGDTLTVTAVGNAVNGAVVANGDGTFTFTPAANFSGIASFEYTVSDGNGGTDTGTVVITVAPLADAPSVTGVDLTVPEADVEQTLYPQASAAVTDTDGSESLVELRASGVTGYDFRINGDVVTLAELAAYGPVTFAGAGNGGTLDVEGNFTLDVGSGEVVFTITTPGVTSFDLNAAGHEHFGIIVPANDHPTFEVTFRAVSQEGSDTGNRATGSTVIDVVVTPVNDAPVAEDDSETTAEDTPVTVDVLANDTDVDGDTLVITDVTQGANGAVTFTGTDVTYTPNANFHGSDSFTYTVSDGNGGTATATVEITVTPVNDAPVADDADITTAEDTPVDGTVAATDVDGDTLTFMVVDEPLHGTLDFETDGSFTYTPDANYNGPDSFTFKANDGSLDSNVATVSITVGAVNDAPVATDDMATTAEDTPISFTQGDLAGNDTDIDDDTLTVTAVGNAVNGAVVLNGDGTITFTPAANFHGAASFDYTVSDGNGGTDTGTVNITVTPVADDPIAVDDPVTVAEDSFNNPIDVLSNDSDPDGDTISVIEVGTPAHGDVSIGPGGITYTPDPNYFGPDSFVYKIQDSTGRMAMATVLITVTPVNDAPVATDDTATTAEDTPISFTQADLVGNDTDIDGDTLTVTAVGNAVNGSVVLNGDGTITFTPAANFHGAASFDYTVSDGNGGTDTGTVNITVTPVNDAPVAVDDTATTAEDTPVTVSGSSLLGNDSDVDGDTVTITGVSNAVNGAVVDNGDGTFTFTPAANFHGAASFDYTISDGNGGTDTGTVNITVTPVNDAPVAEDDTATTAEDTPVTIDVLTNDDDVDGDVLTTAVDTPPAHGTATPNPDGSFTYTPAANFHGTDSFTYTVSDGNGGTDTASVSITVTPVNDAPAAEDDAISTLEDTPIDGTVSATDVDGDALTFMVVDEPLHGTLDFEADGSFTYTPDENYHGPDSFTFKANDGTVDSNVATVSITVESVNDAPVAEDDTATVNEDSAANTINVLANDTDVEGHALTVTAATHGAHGSVAISPDGLSVTYTPDPNFAGTDSFTYTISDGNGGTDTATVNVTVLNIDSDFQGTDANDVFLVRRDPTGTNIEVYDNETASGTPVFSAPYASVDNLMFDMLAGDDRLIISFQYGNPLPSGGTTYLGGSHGTIGDQLTVFGTVLTDGSYAASSTTEGSGVVTVGGQNISLTGVEPINVHALNSFTVRTPNPDDALTISSVSTSLTKLAGLSGGVPLSPVTFSEVSTFVIDAAAADAGDGDDTLTVAATGAAPVGIGFIQYQSGTGTNVLDVQTGTARIDSTVAAAGTLDTIVGTGDDDEFATLVTHRFRQTSLDIQSGGAAVILPDGTNNATSVLNSLTIADGGTLDINDNAVIVNYTGASPEAAIRAKILEGRGAPGIGGGLWNGDGITSSIARQSNMLSPESRSVGYANNASLPLGVYTTFRGQAVDPTSILIAYTRTADANLDGVVNNDDVAIVGANYAPGFPRPYWALGDFDYNGFVDNDDITLLGAFYNPAATPVPAPAPAPLAVESLAELPAGGLEAAGDDADDALVDMLAEAIAVDDGAEPGDPALATSGGGDMDSIWTEDWLK